MDFYNTTFYDKASTEYSDRRYGGKTESYIQFFFKKRLALILKALDKNTFKKTDLKILEIGCADGIVIKTILNRFPQIFSNGVGTDISPEMIEVARRKNGSKNLSFFLKNSDESGNFDFVLAVGFMSPGIFETEFSYIKKYLKPNGVIIISLASKDSLYAKIKLRDKEYVKDYWNHSEYEEYLKKDFELIKTYPYGLFIPKLWAIPFLARIIQPIIEIIFNKIAPNLFHEKLYILKSKS